MGNKYIIQNKETYDQIAKHFSDTRSYVWDDLKPLSKYVKNGDVILDVGCGNGRLLQLFSGTHLEYTGIDQSEELIEVAKTKYPEKNFVVGTMAGLPFPDDSFDVVYCIAAFHHLPTDDLRIDALNEMKRVVKKEGMIVLMNWNLESKWAQNKVEAGSWVTGESRDHFIIPWKNAKGEAQGERHYWSITQERMKRLAGLAGLNVEEKFYTKRGEKSDRKLGENMVSVLSK